MSAWQVSTEHVLVLAHASNLPLHAVAKIAADLWNENNRSLHCRYGDEIDERTPAAFMFEIDLTPSQRDTPGHYMALAKSLACYEYQACECSDFQQSKAAAYCAELESVLARHIGEPGQWRTAPWWDEIPWGLDSRHVKLIEVVR